MAEQVTPHSRRPTGYPRTAPVLRAASSDPVAKPATGLPFCGQKVASSRDTLGAHSEATQTGLVPVGVVPRGEPSCSHRAPANARCADGRRPSNDGVVHGIAAVHAVASVASSRDTLGAHSEATQTGLETVGVVGHGSPPGKRYRHITLPSLS